MKLNRPKRWLVLGIFLLILTFGTAVFSKENALPDTSIYQLSSTWMNDFGKKVSIKSLQGQIQLVAMIYTTCKHACPMTVSHMKKIEMGLPEEIKKQVGFVLFSIDPKHDTHKVMALYRKSHSLEKMHWTLLTGSAEDVENLAAVLHFQYKPLGKGMFSHSNLVTVVDPTGRIEDQESDGGQDLEKILGVIQTLAKKSASDK